MKAEKHKNRMRPAKKDSKMSNGRLSGVLCWPHGGRLSGVLCWPHGQNSPAQRDSGDNMRGDLPPVVYNIWSAQSTKY